MSIRCYSELSQYRSFVDRYRYLRLEERIGEATFGFDRYVNQRFYTSYEWKKTRDLVIVRDGGRDLGVEGNEIYGKILVHHMNPILLKDIETSSKFLMDPEFLITTTHATHNAIHFGDESLLIQDPIERTKNDTCPWRTT